MEVSLNHFDIWHAMNGAICRSWCSSINIMVDIRSMAASSHPSRQEKGTEGEATSHTRVG
jgi:hypothetical protein